MPQTEIKIVYRAGNYAVYEIEKLACPACRAGWSDGTIPSPKVSGVRCTHGRGRWQAGQVGPRGGWYPFSPTYAAERAAVLVCDALAAAAEIPIQGV